MDPTNAACILVADGEREQCAKLSARLRDANCSVLSVQDIGALTDVLDLHARTKARLTALVVNGFLTCGGITELHRAGIFDIPIPVIVTLPPHRTEYVRIARAAGALLSVDRTDVCEIVRAVRHVVDRHRRWDGEWISNDPVEGFDGRADAPGWPSKH